MPFAHCRTLRNNGAFRAFHETAEVGFQLYNLNVAVAIYAIYLVVIKENAKVIDSTLHVDVFPWPCRLFAYENLKAMTVDVREDIEFPVMIADAWCPDALAVRLFMIFKAELIPHVEPRQAITGEIPVHQVTRM